MIDGSTRMKRTSRYSTLVMLLAVHTAAGVVIYSGYQNIVVPLNQAGVNLNPVTNETTTALPSDWNTSPWINPFYGGVYVASSEALRPVVIGADELVNQSVGTLISSGANFATGESGSSTHVGPNPGQFTLGVPGFIGFAFEATVGGPTRYGWVNLTVNNTGAGAIRDWAYDDATGGIVVGRVQQSAPVSGAQTFTLSPGLGESFDLGSAITDSNGNINSVHKIGAGTTRLVTANSFTGATVIDAGTLEAAVAGALGNTSAVTVNAGGTLLLGGTGDRVNDNAAVTLGGGTLATAGLSEALGTLTLSASSVIDFGDALSLSTLSFANSSALAGSWTGILSIHNWTGSVDRLFFGSDATGLQQSQLGQIYFYSGSGAGFLGTGTLLNTGEVVPVPEPTAGLAAVALLGLAGWREGRRRR